MFHTVLFIQFSRIFVQKTAKIQISTLFFEIVEKAGNLIFRIFVIFHSGKIQNIFFKKSGKIQIHQLEKFQIRYSVSA